eukprot:TRINITY_DN15318_c0_g1_i5.p1 TRINITY_DN15318_c0_g1~~TRINITY_DN15318_c0_g1_i5.p1  ORF type:complete len:211 (+),score=34.62 TRINITY_DN15318_c0_g1_i5:106-738(+)
MLRSLVGSEMCIRDRAWHRQESVPCTMRKGSNQAGYCNPTSTAHLRVSCLSIPTSNSLTGQSALRSDLSQSGSSQCHDRSQPASWSQSASKSARRTRKDQDEVFQRELESPPVLMWVGDEVFKVFNGAIQFAMHSELPSIYVLHRDLGAVVRHGVLVPDPPIEWVSSGVGTRAHRHSKDRYPCLLYTSDAADEEDSVDLGGRRIIKKKKK